MKLLAFIPSVLLALLLWLLLRRRVYQTFPCFFAYVVFAIFADMARFAARNYHDAYFATYWISEAGYDVLGLLVMYEVSRSLLGRLTKAWWGPFFFPVVLIGSICLSVERNQATAAQVGGLVMLYILIAEIAVRFVQVIMFAGLVMLVPVIGLRWRQYPFGIVTGFGVYSTVALLTTTKVLDFGTNFKFLWGVSLVVSYSIAVLIWIWFFYVPPETEIPGPKQSALTPGDLQRYKEALRRMR